MKPPTSAKMMPSSIDSETCFARSTRSSPHMHADNSARVGSTRVRHPCKPPQRTIPELTQRTTGFPTDLQLNRQRDRNYQETRHIQANAHDLAAPPAAYQQADRPDQRARPPRRLRRHPCAAASTPLLRPNTRYCPHGTLPTALRRGQGDLRASPRQPVVAEEDAARSVETRAGEPTSR